MHLLPLRPVLTRPDRCAGRTDAGRADAGRADARPGDTCADDDHASPDHRAGALGIALRHFTDQLRCYRRLHAADLHAATAVLTKQIETLLGTDPSLSTVADLLVDPDRIALPDRTTAADLLGTDWPHFVADVTAHVASTRAFVNLHGLGPMLTLSAWYGVSDRSPWWGTDGWAACVDGYAAANRPPARLRELLHEAPEVVDHLTLSRILHDARRHQWSVPLADRRPIPA